MGQAEDIEIDKIEFLDRAHNRRIHCVLLRPQITKGKINSQSLDDGNGFSLLSLKFLPIQLHIHFPIKSEDFSKYVD